VNALQASSWSPYAVGAGIGVLSWFTLASAKRPLGVTTAFESSAASLGQSWFPRVSGVNTYLAHGGEVPELGWEWMLDLGIVLGSFISARLSGDSLRGLPHPWRRRFGPSARKRYASAFAGGALVMFGARMAKGCTSGHAISGALQLAGSSWLFSLAMAISAVSTARALFGRGGR
jgi:uncharacterized membrane protein YedE/YeeE